MTTNRLATRHGALLAVFTASLLGFLALPAMAQDEAAADTSNKSNPQPTERAQVRPVEISHFRPHDARALNQFEPPKAENIPYTGFKLTWGAAFTQQFQALDHENTATPVISGTPPVNQNQLIEIGAGFNNADANLYMDAQVA